MKGDELRKNHEHRTSLLCTFGSKVSSSPVTVKGEEIRKNYEHRTVFSLQRTFESKVSASSPVLVKSDEAVTVREHAISSAPPKFLWLWGTSWSSASPSSPVTVKRDEAETDGTCKNRKRLINSSRCSGEIFGSTGGDRIYYKCVRCRGSFRSSQVLCFPPLPNPRWRDRSRSKVQGSPPPIPPIRPGLRVRVNRYQGTSSRVDR